MSGAEIRAWLESSAKFIASFVAAGAVVSATFIGARYESKLSSVNLMSERENAESSIRSAMFQSLVQPLTSLSPDQQLNPDRYRVLVELLTLNFHDQFEVKPLLDDVDRILGKNKEGRKSLRSVARRIIDRQIASLSGTSQIVWGKPAKVEAFFFNSTGDGSSETRSCQSGASDSPIVLGSTACSVSPDGKYHLEIGVFDPDPKNTTVKVGITICRKAAQCSVGGEDWLRSFSFRLTHFDFPLTDNAPIDPDHRFAISLYSYREEGAPIIMKLVWFPLGFITARERPMNYQVLRKALGIDETEEMRGAAE